MSKIYKSARGKMVDMDKVKIANEQTVAVGNMKVNARGDILGAGNQVAAGRNAVMDRVYAVDSGSYSPNDPTTHAETQATMEASKAKDLHDLANSLVAPSNPETPVQPTNTARGSLAGSVAKTTAVNQEPMADPRKPKGPSRI